MNSVRCLVRDGEHQLVDSESSRLDAELLLASCLGKSRTWLYSHSESGVDPETERVYRDLLARRAVGEPMAYILGAREFWGLELACNPHTLIPRPDTESLVEYLLHLPLPETARILDLGTGTGAIALALASERPRWSVTAVDSVAEALQLAESNRQSLGLPAVHWRQSRWFEAIEAGETFHAIVGNPPYVASADACLDQGDVRFEPRSALVSGPDGLDDIRDILISAPNFMEPGCWLVLEHGSDQAGKVASLYRDSGLLDVCAGVDLSGRPRFTSGRTSPRD